MLKFMEEAVYDTTHDGSLKTAMKANRVPEEWLEYKGPAAIMEEVIEALNTEKKAAEDKAKEAAADAARPGAPQPTLSQ